MGENFKTHVAPLYIDARFGWDVTSDQISAIWTSVIRFLHAIQTTRNPTTRDASKRIEQFKISRHFLSQIFQERAPNIRHEQFIFLGAQKDALWNIFEYLDWQEEKNLIFQKNGKTVVCEF